MESTQNICSCKRIRIVVCILILIVSFSSQAQLVINEVLVKNGGVYCDENGDCPAVLEVYNTSNAPIGLQNYYISDEFQDLSKWRLPFMDLNAQERAIIFLSNKDRSTPIMHADFRLVEGENLYLSLITGTTLVSIDSLSTTSHHYNVSISRYPDGVGPFLFTSPSISQVNNPGELAILNDPVVSINSGVAAVGSVFSVSPASAYTTLDGFEPVSGGLNMGLYTIPDPYLNPLRFSLIPTNPSLTYPIGDYTESRANNRGWLPPVANQPKLVIVRSQQIANSGLKSNQTVRSIFTTVPEFNLPIVSLITDSLGFFDPEKGISVYGNNPDGNYNLRGRQSERLVYMHVFDSLGNLKYETSAGMRIKGNGSRHSAMKNLRFIQRSLYPGVQGEETAFLAKYSLLRGGGHRPDCFGRDYLSQKFVATLPFLKSKPSMYACYMNGEFWGIYDLRANIDEAYVESHFALPKDSSAFADHTYIVQTENYADTLEFANLTLFAQNNDLSVEANYNYVSSRLDLEEFISVNCAQIFLGNADYPRTNNGWFVVRNGHSKSKWHNYFFDLDGGFGGDCDTILRTFNALSYYLQTGTTEWTKANRLLRNLLNNPEFEQRFASDMADLLNSNFRADVLQTHYNNYLNEIEPNRLLQVNRWGYPSVATTLIDRYAETPSLTKWDELNNAMSLYLDSRQRYVFRHFMNYFGYPDSSRIYLNVSDAVAGTIQVNSLLLHAETPGFDQYPWNGLYFQSVPVALTAFAKRGYRFDQWSNGQTTPEQTILLQSDSTLLATFVADAQFQEPHINEVLTANVWSETDRYAQHEPWIELYNPNSYPISLEGYFLSNDLNDPTKFSFKAQTIKASDYLILFASGVSERGKEHVNFVLGSGDTLYLIAPDGISVLQQIIIPDLTYDQSYGSSPNGSLTYTTFTYPTPRANNNESGINAEYKLKNTFILFPNPGEHSVCLDPPGKYELVDLHGYSLIPLAYTDCMHVADLAPGMYFVRSENGGIQRFVKVAK